MFRVPSLRRPWSVLVCAAIPMLCLTPPAAAQDACPLKPAPDSIIFFAGWRGTSTVAGAVPLGSRPRRAASADTVRGKLISVSCAMWSVKPVVEVEGVRYDLDDLNIPLWSAKWQRSFPGTIRLWREGRLVPAAYLADESGGTLVDADSLHRALQDPNWPVTGVADPALAVRYRAFTDSIARYDEANRREKQAAHRDFLAREFAAIRKESLLPAATRPAHRWEQLPDSLPPGYLGDDLTALIRRLASAAPGDGEGGLDMLRRGGLDTTAWFAMVVDVGRVCGYLGLQYDAARSQLHVAANQERASPASGVLVPAQCTSTRAGQHVRANAAGAAITVTDMALTYTGLEFVGERFYGFSGDIATTGARATMMKPRIRLVAFARPVSVDSAGFGGKSSKHTKGTTTAQLEFTSTYLTLHVTDVTLVAVDSVTGRFLAVLSPR